jgi:hypothetical protein
VSFLKLHQSNALSIRSMFPCSSGLKECFADFLSQNPNNAPRHADQGGRLKENTSRSRADRVMKFESRVRLVFTEASVHGSLPHTALGNCRKPVPRLDQVPCTKYPALASAWVIGITRLIKLHNHLLCAALETGKGMDSAILGLSRLQCSTFYKPHSQLPKGLS